MDSAEFAAVTPNQTTLFSPQFGFSVEKRAKRAEADSNSANKTDADPRSSQRTPPSDPSTWRKSTLPTDTEISKDDARSQYRLAVQDFSSFKFRLHFTKEGHTAHLYLEWEIERKAWEKHGGPEGWDAHLENLRKRHLKRYGSAAAFSEPQLPHDKIRIAEVFRKQEANLYEKFPPWLWNQLKDFYRASPIYRKLGFHNRICVPGCDSRAERLDMIRAADEHKLLEMFPPRNDEIPIPDSESFNALRELLADAPVAEEEMNDAGIMSNRLVKKRWNGRTLYDWADEFQKRVTGAVNNIAREHDPQDKLRAVWMVYDAYAKSLWPFGMRFVGNTTRTTVGEELGHWEIKAIQVFRLLEN